MRCLPSSLSLCRKLLNKFNNTGARMLDSLYHMALKLLKMHFWRENIKMLPSFTQPLRYFTKSVTSGLSIFCMALYHYQRRRHNDKKKGSRSFQVSMQFQLLIKQKRSKMKIVLLSICQMV